VRYALGGQVALPLTVTDATTALVDAATVVMTVTLPDGTTTTLSLAGATVTRTSTGTYVAYYTTIQAGRHTWSAATTAPVTQSPPDAFMVGALADAPIVGLGDIREHLAITTNGTDAILLTLGQRASDLCENKTGQIWRRTTITGELYSGGGSALILQKPPASSITTVVETGVTLTSSDYTLDPSGGMLYRGPTRSGMLWLWGRSNISLTYVAGPPGGIVPDDLAHSVLELIAHFWDVRRGGSQTRRGAGAVDDWDPRQGFTVPRRVSEVWDSYKPVGFA
jgi:uncharacterized phiE125 gp8 family phage protein